MSKKSPRFIEDRLASIAGLAGKYLVVDPVVEQQAVAEIWSTFFADAKVKSALQPRVKRHDISHVSDLEVKRILRNFAGSKNQSALVGWHSERVAVTTQLEVFIDHYDDFWYPSSDDVWVVPFDFRWLIEISHEEVITISEANPG